MMFRGTTRLAGATTALVLAGLGLAACSSSSGSGTTSSSETAPTPAAASESGQASASTGGQASASAGAADAVFAPDGYVEPASGGPKATPGKKVMVLSCGQNQETCSVAADAQMEAAKAIGWDATLVDFASDYDAAQKFIRSAVAGQYDGIVAYALDCPLVSEAMSEARDAGLFIVGAEGEDCPSNGYSSIVSYTQGDFPTWFTTFGKKQGEVALAEAGPGANILVIRETDIPNLDYAYNGLMEAINECADCTVADTVEFTYTDFGPKLEQKIGQALVKNPDVNVVTIPYDSVLLASALPALRSSGKLNSVVVAAAEGQTGTLDLIRSGSLNATGVGVAQGWEGWATIDAMNRAFAGAEQVPSGIGLMAYDKDHNLPESGPLQYPVDYETAYKANWGVN